MKLPYGYVLNDEEIVIHEEWADVVCRIFEYYVAGASLGKFVDMLFTKKQEIISAVQRENTVVLYRWIGSTTYKVRIHFSDTAQKSMEDKIIRLIGSETMDMAPDCGIMMMPQMSRQPEGNTELAVTISRQVSIPMYNSFKDTH